MRANDLPPDRRAKYEAYRSAVLRAAEALDLTIRDRVEFETISFGEDIREAGDIDLAHEAYFGFMRDLKR